MLYSRSAGMIGFDGNGTQTCESSVTSKISQTLQLPTSKLQLQLTLTRNLEDRTVCAS